MALILLVCRGVSIFSLYPKLLVLRGNPYARKEISANHACRDVAHLIFSSFCFQYLSFFCWDCRRPVILYMVFQRVDPAELMMHHKCQVKRRCGATNCRFRWSYGTTHHA